MKRRPCKFREALNPQTRSGRRARSIQGLGVPPRPPFLLTHLEMFVTPLSLPILYDQRQRYSLDDTTQTNAISLDDTTQTNAIVPPRAATASPALSGEAWLRRLENMQESPAGVGESWLRDEEQGDSGHAATELLELLEPRQTENPIGLGPETSQRERRLSSEWREAMSARARRRFHAQPQAASAKTFSGAKEQRGVTSFTQQAFPVPSTP